MTDTTEQLYPVVNGTPKNAHPEGARYYDEGWNDCVRGNTMSPSGSFSYREGYRDCQTAPQIHRVLIN